METTHLSAEFTLSQRKAVDRSNPLRWLVAHTLHYWPLSISLLIGAIANGALAAAVPV
jgi:hypothetical protein